MMNKRLKELFMQTLSESENMRWNIEDAERFAELIVDECVEKCKTDWYGDSLDDICVQMLEHFGIKK